MNILVIGDIYGQVGRSILEEYLASLRKDYQIDFVIVNGENISHGKSMIKEHYHFLKRINVDVITGGNHTFDKPDMLDLIVDNDDILRPLNSNPYHSGKGSSIFTVKDKKIRVTNLIGSVFMGSSQNAYFEMDTLLKEDDSDIHLVDYHAEASAEKIALAWNYDGKITALWGTHTHVQTNDARILPKGTGFITDIGMTGAYYSIIGANPTEVIYRQKNNLPIKFKPAIGEGQINGIVLFIDDITNKVIKIENININPHKEYPKVIK